MCVYRRSPRNAWSDRVSTTQCLGGCGAENRLEETDPVHARASITVAIERNYHSRDMVTRVVVPGSVTEIVFLALVDIDADLAAVFWWNSIAPGNHLRDQVHQRAAERCRDNLAERSARGVDDDDAAVTQSLPRIDDRTRLTNDPPRNRGALQAVDFAQEGVQHLL
jgi:hypothetical protein